MHKLMIKDTKNLVILHMLHFTNCVIFEIGRQKLNKRLSNIVNIIVKVLISKLSFRSLNLEIYLVLRNQCLSISDLLLLADLHVLALIHVILVKRFAT